MNRFELVHEKEIIRSKKFGHVADLNVIKDTKTGVLYAIAVGNQEITMTHLVDREGLPLVDDE